MVTSGTPPPPDLEARLDEYLAGADDELVSPVEAAARAYLDVCFFHPFADGNARAGRLVLDHVLTRHRLAPASFEPIGLVARTGTDVEVLFRLAWMLSYLCYSRP